MFIIYDILFFLFFLMYIPYMIIKRKWHVGYGIRFGFFPKSLLAELNQKPNIWIHAVSVGEVLAVENLINRLKQIYPYCRIVCSTVTETGNNLARQKLDIDDIVIYSPLDLSFIARKFISVINPKIYICAETEIWPNLYNTLHNAKVPVIQINGRISDKAFRGYKRFTLLTKKILQNVNMFCMQSQEDAERIKYLGAPSEKVRVTGNLKFDALPPDKIMSKEGMGFERDDILFIAGSTHPGEEEIMLDIYKRLKGEFKHLRFVIAPRHIERSNGIMNLVKECGFQPIQFSRMNNIKFESPPFKKGDLGGFETPKLFTDAVVIVDTIGHLRALYSASDIVFVGKSLTSKGGQNVIEPAFYGKPVIVGPYTQNFRDIIHAFLMEGALIQVNNSEELFNKIVYLLRNPEKMDEIGQSAKRVIQNQQGSMKRSIEAIEENLSIRKG